MKNKSHQLGRAKIQNSRIEETFELGPSGALSPDGVDNANRVGKLKEKKRCRG
jgi:hypothetical protein